MEQMKRFVDGAVCVVVWWLCGELPCLTGPDHLLSDARLVIGLRL